MNGYSGKLPIEGGAGGVIKTAALLAKDGPTGEYNTITLTSNHHPTISGRITIAGKFFNYDGSIIPW